MQRRTSSPIRLKTHAMHGGQKEHVIMIDTSKMRIPSGNAMETEPRKRVVTIPPAGARFLS